MHVKVKKSLDIHVYPEKKITREMSTFRGRSQLAEGVELGQHLEGVQPKAEGPLHV